MYGLLRKLCSHKIIPDDWKKGVIVKLPKKGNLNDCKNAKGITFLSILRKILGRVVIDRIRNGVDKRLRKKQVSYRRGRGTTDQVLIVRNIVD